MALADAAGAASDVDVAVWLSAEEGSGGLDRVALFDRGLELASDLEDGLGRPVDVVVLTHAPMDLVHSVLRHGRLIFSRDEGARTRFYVDHARRYLDMEPVRTLLTRFMVRRIKEGRFGGRRSHGTTASGDHRETPGTPGAGRPYIP